MRVGAGQEWARVPQGRRWKRVKRIPELIKKEKDRRVMEVKEEEQ